MKRKTELVFILFFFSGLAGLIYESVWSHYVKLFLGHAAYGQTLVLVVFIGGLALGSWLCARVAERIRNPLRLYALVEGVIGVLALLFHWVFVHAIEWGYTTLLPATCDQASTFCAAQWLLSAALLAPQSILLGATFPLVSSAVLRMSGEHPGHDIATLYFLNSLGAVLGVMASAFVLIPAVGLPGTLLTAGLANLVIALVAYGIAKSAPTGPLVVSPAPAAHEDRWTDRRIVTVLLATAMLTGLSSFIYEIAWIRMLSLVLGASTHSFELMLASFILGLALGGLWIRSRVDAYADTVRLLAYVQLLMGIFAVATLPLYNAAFDFMAWLLSALSRTDGGFVLFNMASTFISLVVMLPATFCAGMTLPLITYRLLRSSSGERSLGAVYAINTLGSILGVIVAVHLLMSRFGTPATLMVGAAIDVLLGVVLLLRRSGAAGRRAAVPMPAVMALVAFIALVAVIRVDPLRSASGVFRTGLAHLSGSSILFHRDGKTATVDVVGDANFRAIRTNGKVDAAMSLNRDRPIEDEYTMALLAVLPLAHQLDARSAAVIGFGSGSSTTLLLASDRLERVDTIEIEPSMVEGARLFRPFVEPAYTDPRSHIVIDDAKSYFARGRSRYDIIVSEPSNPWVSGVSSLFTDEFYKRLALYLNDRGIVSQWLHVYEMDSETLASVIAAFGRTFPRFIMYMPNDGDIVMIARKTGPVGPIDPKVLSLPRLQPTLAKLRITDLEQLQRFAVGSSATLRPLFGTYGVGPNSDYFPIVDHRASKTRFTKSRVPDLSDLQEAGVPMLEMLDGAFVPTTQPRPAAALTAASIAAVNGWSIYGGATGVAEARRDAKGDVSEENAGRILRLWGTTCSDSWTFAQALPLMVRMAEVVAPQLQPDFARTMWHGVAESRCGRALSADDRRWIELFDAVAARDAARMARLGQSLTAAATAPDAASEYAFVAGVTGMICRGEAAQAKEFMEKNTGRVIRRGQKMTQLRYLHAIAKDPQAAAVAARCR